jgi:hypothetical protein
MVSDHDARFPRNHGLKCGILLDLIPELLFSRSDYGPAADLRVVGCIMHVMRTGRVFSDKRMDPQQFAQMFPTMGNLIQYEWPELLLARRSFLFDFNEFLGNLIPDSACVVRILKIPKLNPQNQS